MKHRLALPACTAALSLLAAEPSGAQCLIEALDPPGLEDGAFFGQRIDASGDVLAATVRQYQGSAGALVATRAPSGTWSAPTLIPLPVPFEDKLDVSVDGDVLVVGAALGGNQSPLVRVYRRPGAGTAFALEQALLPPAPNVQSEFGSFVSVSGDRIAVGAPEQSDLAPRAGAIFMFERGPSGNWVFDERIDPIDPSGARFFGRSFDLEGDRLAVAESGEFSAGSKAVTLYSRGAAGWTVEQSFPPTPGDRFGWDVLLDGDELLIGAPSQSVPGVGRVGSIQLHRDTANGWRFIQDIESPTGGVGTEFGSSLTVSDSLLAVSSGSWIGASTPQPVFTFERASLGRFVPVATVTPSSDALGFGTGVALAAGDLWIGNYGAPIVGTFRLDRGTVARYSFDALTETLCAPYTANSTGDAGELTVGFGCPTVLENDLVLRATSLPPGQTAFLAVGDVDLSFPGTITGEIRNCLGGTLGRAFIGFTSPTGNAFAAFDVNGIPGPAGPIPASVGQTYYAQVFHRDPGALAGFHATNAVRVTVR